MHDLQGQVEFALFASDEAATIGGLLIRKCNAKHRLWLSINHGREHALDPSLRAARTRDLRSVKVESFREARRGHGIRSKLAQATKREWFCSRHCHAALLADQGLSKS
jgi:hypothetical protein